MVEFTTLIAIVVIFAFGYTYKFSFTSVLALSLLSQFLTAQFVKLFGVQLPYVDISSDLSSIWKFLVSFALNYLLVSSIFYIHSRVTGWIGEDRRFGASNLAIGAVLLGLASLIVNRNIYLYLSIILLGVTILSSVFVFKSKVTSGIFWIVLLYCWTGSVAVWGIGRLTGLITQEAILLSGLDLVGIPLEFLILSCWYFLAILLIKEQFSEMQKLFDSKKIRFTLNRA